MIGRSFDDWPAQLAWASLTTATSFHIVESRNRGDVYNLMRILSSRAAPELLHLNLSHASIDFSSLSEVRFSSLKTLTLTATKIENGSFAILLRLVTNLAHLDNSCSTRTELETPGWPACFLLPPGSPANGRL